MKLFSTYNPKIVDRPDDIDSQSFHWTDRSANTSTVHIPLMAKINGCTYMMTDFNNSSPICILIDVPSLVHAINVSIDAYGVDTISTLEWIAIRDVATKLNIELSNINIPLNVVKHNKDFFGLIDKMALWPDTLLNYLTIKAVPWRTLYLITLMDEQHINYVTSYVEHSSPSVQSFKQFVETVRDFASVITDEKYDLKRFSEVTSRLSPMHEEILEKMTEIKNTINPVSINNRDNFETCSLHINFTISSADDYSNTMSKLMNAKYKIDELYALFNKGLL